MIKFKLFLLFLFFIIQGCGYQSIHKTKISDFTIINVETIGDKKISRYLENSFERFKDNQKSNNIYEIITTSQVNKTILSKNSAGVSENLLLKITVNIKIKENGNIIREKLFKENARYSNLVNKFELKQYEKIIIKDQTAKIIHKIILFISSIK